MRHHIPGLMITIIFNNFFVNKAAAPFFMKWAIYVSPMAWSIEQIATGIYGRDAQPGALVIGRHYITECDGVPVQYNGIV